MRTIPLSDVFIYYRNTEVLMYIQNNTDVYFASGGERKYKTSTRIWFALLTLPFFTSDPL